MATQMTVWRPFAEFGELRQRLEIPTTAKES
jgi:hypothetical protein